jgi:hypothetical protein
VSFGATLDATIERVRRDALLGLSGPIYTLRTAYVAGADTLEIEQTPEHMSMGSVVAVDAELFHVIEVDAGSKILTVAPGFYGTTEANHALGAIVEVDPRVPKASLVDWAEQEIESWRGQLFRVLTDTIDTTVTGRVFELAVPAGATVDFILDVRAMPLGTPWDSTWSLDSWPRHRARLLRSMPVSEFPSGYAIQLYQPTREATQLRVAYASGFDLDPFTLATDLVADCGLTRGMVGVLEEGIRARTLSSGLLPRTDWRATGMSRDAEQVTLLDIVRATDMARSLRDRRLAEEALDLRKQFPYASWG